MLADRRGRPVGVRIAYSLNYRSVLDQNLLDTPADRDRMHAHSNLTITKAFVEGRENWISRGSDNRPMEIPVGLDEGNAIVSNLLLSVDQSVKVVGKDTSEAARLLHAPFFDQTTSLHDRVDFGLCNRRDIRTLLGQNFQQAVSLEPQECFPHRGSRHACFPADLRFRQECRLMARQSKHMLFQPGVDDILRRVASVICCGDLHRRISHKQLVYKVPMKESIAFIPNY